MKNVIIQKLEAGFVKNKPDEFFKKLGGEKKNGKSKG